ncbi:MAG: UbiA family prenyltransferase [Candidatus Theseobacter exili]|nr:UbiA family prenyltransferase [Candidatus Theseobacter exili]
MSKKTRRIRNKPKIKRFSLDTVVRKLEDYEIGIAEFAITFLSITILRSFIEGLMERPHIIGILKNVRMSSWAFLIHFPLFYLSCFTVIFLVIKAVAKVHSAKIAKFLLLFLPLILFAPVFDYFWTKGEGFKLAYAMSGDKFISILLGAFIPFKSVPVISPGMRIETFVMFSGAITYIYLKTRSILKSVSGAVLAYSIIICIGSMPAVIQAAANLLFKAETNNLIIDRSFLFLKPNCMIDLFDKKMTAVYVILLTVLGVAYLIIDRKKSAKAIILSLRTTRYIHYLLLLSFGVLLGYRLSGGTLFDPYQPFNYIGLAVLFLSLLYGLHSATLLNDIVDKQCDALSSPERALPAGTLTEKGAIALAIGFLIMALIAALSINFACFIVVLIAWIVSYIYSMPPFQLKKYMPFNLFSLAATAYLSMLCGFAAFSRVLAPQFLPWKATIAVLVYVFLSVSIKDLKDYDGDKACGYQTFMTLLGPKKGKIAIGLLVWISYTVTPLIFGQKIMAFIGFAVGAANFFYIRLPKSKELPLFISYYVVGTVVCIMYVFTLKPLPAKELAAWKPLPPVERKIRKKPGSGLNRSSQISRKSSDRKGYVKVKSSNKRSPLPGFPLQHKINNRHRDENSN